MASVVDLKSKEEKDAELDRKIEALRKKNEALIKRHKLIEEDRKMAEQEGIAITAQRKGKQSETEPDKARKEKENKSITVEAGEKWVATERKSPRSSHPISNIETTPKSPTRRGSGRTRTFSGGRSLQKEGSGDEERVYQSERPTRGRRSHGTDQPFMGDEDQHHPERPMRSRRSLGMDSRRPARGAVDASTPERWASYTRGGGRGGGTPGRGGGTPGRGGGTPGRGDGTPGRGDGTPGRGDGTPGRGGGTPGRGGGTPGRGGGTPGREGPGGGVDGTPGPDRKIKEWEEKRKINIEKMNEEMEKIAEYERSQRDGVREKNPIRNFLDDPRRSGPVPDIDRKEGSRRHNRNWGGADFDKVKTGMDREKETHVRRGSPRNQLDMTLSMTGRERAEYMRWKKEREQIDQERLARHRNATGQWKREWDVEKTESMFKDDAPNPQIDDEPAGRRDKGKRGAPKPPTMAEFLSESFSTSRKRGPNRSRGQSKPYSMHDSRWEEPEEPQETKESTDGQEKETCVEKVAETKVEELPKELNAKEVVEEADVEDEEGEWESASEEEETKSGVSPNPPTTEAEEAEDVEDEDGEWESEEEVVVIGCSVEEQNLTVTPQSSRKEQKPLQNAETPKPTTPPSNTGSPEDSKVESFPTTPFSPDGYQPVSDWGEEMDLLSPRESSSEDSPPQVPNKREAEVRSIADVSLTDPVSEPQLTEADQIAVECPPEDLTSHLVSESQDIPEPKQDVALQKEQSAEKWTEEVPKEKPETSSLTPTEEDNKPQVDGVQVEEKYQIEKDSLEKETVLILTDSKTNDVAPSS
ncbi:coiled-coil domain-containing protein 9 isoform X2 [Bombina bombina]|uniref:coiled-coil domain-containing protein 9 isoform X2 n=1 Tax=Bombina bombina TaxID=8345 RepID=UPI00235A5920|nr:coiled-coil domain-containing protein 9 isoform X2 [Bombina bombina]